MCRVSMMATECAMIAPAAEEQEPADSLGSPPWTGSCWSRMDTFASRKDQFTGLPWLRPLSKLIDGVMGTGSITEDGCEPDDSDNEHGSKQDATN